jgi:peptidoglycan/LPS O-acetylase OafA/YrhL
MFNVVGFLAVAVGGLLAAFSARRPSRLMLWLVAYLVLIEGLVQIGLAAGWRQLDMPGSWPTLAAFLIYNLGNAAVIAGRALKGRTQQAPTLVNLGDALLAAAMLLLAWSVRHAQASWTLAWFLALVLVILISMPIGLLLSSRRKERPGYARPKPPSRT